MLKSKKLDRADENSTNLKHYMETELRGRTQQGTAENSVLKICTQDRELQNKTGSNTY